MRKKVKRIPKYNGGTPYSTAKIDAIANQIKEQMGLLGTGGGLSGTIGGGGTDGGSNYNSPWKNMDTNQKISTGIEALGTVGSLLNTATSGQDVTVGGAISATASGAAMGAQFGGPIGAIVGAGVGLAAGTAGRKRGVDYTTGTADMGSGWMKMFGPSKDHVLYKANMAQNSIQSRQQTENLKADYMNRYGGAVKVAEGGIMRRPVDALVSKGELIYDPTTLKLRQVPGSKGKPNKADDVYAKLYEGDVVISNSPTMLMANGKTPAQNLMGMVDKYATGGTVKAREAIIKKVVNWQEANKTKPQEYAMYDEGTGKDGAQPKTKRVKVRKKEPLKVYEWNSRTGWFDANGGFHELEPNPALWPDSVYMGRYEYKDVPITEEEINENKGVHTSTVLNFNTDRHTRDGVKDKEVKKSSNWRNTPTEEEINAFFGHNREKVVATAAKNRSERINNKNRKYMVDREEEFDSDLPELVVTAPKVNKKGSSSSNSGSSSEKKKTPSPKLITPAEVNQIGLDWAKQAAAEAMAQYKPNTTRPVAPGLVAPKIDPTETVEEAALPGSSTTGNAGNGGKPGGSNWQDGLYRMAVLSQPLWDRAKAEPVDYTSPVYKYMPTQIDVTSQLRDADQSYALARYNFANLYPNTGAGMAAGLQAASDRAKQYADIRQYQTNAQNELIGKNAGIYNNWSNEHAKILNDVYNKSAQNRAAARNINRQNRAAALSNWGTMLSDDKKMAMDKLKLDMLEPMLQYGYLNYNNYLKWKNANGYD